MHKVYSYLLVIFLFCSCSSDKNPPNLAELKGKINSPDFDFIDNEEAVNKIRKVLRIAQGFDPLLPWALLFQAKLNINELNFDEAKQNLLKIDNSSAAVSDAEIEKIRLSIKDNESFTDIERKILLLEASIENTFQNPLIPKLFLLKGLLLEKKKDFHGASNLYKTIRYKFTDSKIAETARLRSEFLTNSEDAPLKSGSIADLMEESKILIKEKKFQSAFETLQQAKSGLKIYSPAYFEILMVEADLLVASDRINEALLLLDIIKSKASVSLSAKAAFTILQLSLLQNNSSESFKFAKNFLSDYKLSPYSDEVRLIYSRFLFENGLLNEALDVLKKNLSSSSSYRIEFESLKLIAWIYFIEGNYKNSSSYFELLSNKTAEIELLLANKDDSYKLIRSFPPFSQKPDQLEEIFLDKDEAIKSISKLNANFREHASYWLGISEVRYLPELDLDSNAGLDDLSLLFSKTLTEFPLGYYSYLAHNNLEEDFPSNYLKQISKVRDDFRGDSSKNNVSCFYIQDTDLKSFNLLFKAGLREEAIREIFWYYSHLEHDDSSLVNNQDLIPLFVSSTLMKLGLTKDNLSLIKTKVPLWLFHKELLTADNYFRSNCSIEYLKLRYPVSNNLRLKSEKEVVSYAIYLVKNMPDYNSENNYDSILKSIKNISSKETDPDLIYLILSVLGSDKELEKFKYYQEMFPKLEIKEILEILPFEELRVKTKEIILAVAWIKFINS